MGPGTPEKDQDGFVITKITLDSSEAGVEGGVCRERGPGESADGPVKAGLSPGSKPQVKPNGELEADRGCQGAEICFTTKRVVPFLIGVDSRAGGLEGWSYSFSLGTNQGPLFIRGLHKRQVERGQSQAVDETWSEPMSDSPPCCYPNES